MCIKLSQKLTLKWDFKFLYEVLGFSKKYMSTTLQYNYIFIFTIICNPCKASELEIIVILVVLMINLSFRKTK